RDCEECDPARQGEHRIGARLRNDGGVRRPPGVPSSLELPQALERRARYVRSAKRRREPRERIVRTGMTTKNVRFTDFSRLAAVRLSALPAMADANGTKGPEARFEKLASHFDKNGDGKLQVTELPARLAKRLGKADADGDGVITATEYTARI